MGSTVWKSYRGRSWFFTSVGLEVFPHKNIVLDLLTFLLISVAIPFLDSLQTSWPNSCSVWLQKLMKIYQHNSPLLRLCTLKSNRFQKKLSQFNPFNFYLFIGNFRGLSWRVLRQIRDLLFIPKTYLGTHGTKEFLKEGNLFLVIDLY